MSKRWVHRIDVRAVAACFLAMWVDAGCGAGDGGGAGPMLAPPVAPDDAAPTPLDDAGDGGALTSVRTEWVPAHAARSLGFTGKLEAYYALYDVPCQSATDCIAPCVDAGAAMTSCSTGSDCVESAETDAGECLPPTYWDNVDDALAASNSTVSAAELVLVDIDYHDAIQVTDFGISIADGATVKGIQFDVHRNADDGFAIDDSVKVVQGGTAVGGEHAGNEAWPQDLEDATYGGPEHTWGVTWTPADLRASGFGISVAPRYTGPASGNDRAHIDSVRARVFFAPP
jgi:hypothetical protein